MDTLAVLVLVLITIWLVVFLVKFGGEGKREPRKLPPGSKGWPIFGEVFSFMKSRPATQNGEFMARRLSRFGKIFMTNLMGRPVLISADAEMNHFILNNESKLFEPEWPRSFLDMVGGHSTAAAVGEAHKRMRSIILDFLSSERLHTVFLDYAEKLALILLGSLEDGSVISATNIALKYSFYIMIKEMFSMSHEDPKTEALMKEYDILVRGIISIPWNIRGTKYQKGIEARRKIFGVFEQIIKERTEKESNEKAGAQKDDLLGWVLKHTDYSQEQLCDFMLHTLFAGYDTTSRAISLMIYFLEGCPKAIQELREEHLRGIKLNKQAGKSKLTWEDYKAMDFTKSVINETLRLGNIASLIYRKAKIDVQYVEYVIPQGGSVMANLTAVHLDPLFFEKPNSFDPWRWLNLSSATRNKNFMPFGGGPRQCPGNKLAKLEMAIFLHYFIMRYNWKLDEHDHPVHAPLVHFFKGLPIKVQVIIS